MFSYGDGQGCCRRTVEVQAVVLMSDQAGTCRAVTLLRRGRMHLPCHGGAAGGIIDGEAHRRYAALVGWAVTSG